MVEREIIWTKTADIQLQNILEYWLNKNLSSEYPRKILKLVTEYIEHIYLRPDSFRLSEHGSNRVCVIGVYSIFFKIKSNKIYITCFWDNRQDPIKLIKVLRRKNGT